MEVGIKLGDQVTVGKARIGFQHHQRHFTRPAKIGPAAKTLFPLPQARCQLGKWNTPIKPPKFTQVKT